MNAYVREKITRRLGERARTARAAGTRILAALLLLPLLTACLSPGAAEQTVVKAVVRAKPLDQTSTPAPTPTTAPTAVPAAVPAAAHAIKRQPISLSTNGGEWQFNTAVLELAAGEDIVLIFHNGAKTTAHNWLLVSGDDYAATEVNTAGMASGAGAGYIPDDPRIIAHTTGLVKGGQSESVAFTAPAAGRYVYLCSFPGHFELGMKGVLTVK
jgi:azurin